MRSVLCQEQRVCPSLPAPSPWFLLGQQEGPRLPEPQPALLGLSCHPHYEKFTRTNAQNMALNSPSRVTLLELLLLWESPKAHWQNGFTMSAYLQGLLRGVNEIKHPKMFLAHRQYQASWRPFLSWGTPPPTLFSTLLQDALGSCFLLLLPRPDLSEGSPQPTAASLPLPSPGPLQSCGGGG